MTTLYKPVLIESAEQAEALPIGTIAVDKPDSAPPVGACIKGSDGGWYETGDPTPWECEQMVGDTALVPIEAEEEWGVEVREGGDPDDVYVIRAADRENAEWRISRLDIPWTRIVRRIGSTPWEEA